MRVASLLFVLTLGTGSLPVQAVVKNGFKLDDALIPVRDIRSGGPPKDGIPAISNPEFLTRSEADFLGHDDRVLGIQINGVSKAYPIKILNWHEIVNDKVDTQHFVVTYCPLCGTGMVFAVNTGDTHLDFGVSGLLYNSDVLLYDRNTGSLWSQIMRKAISGPLKGTELPQLPAHHTTWGDWKAKHPESLVLSTNTGYHRRYEKTPYSGYERSKRLYFKVAHKAPRTYHPKERVMGIEAGGMAKAYPFKELSLNGDARFIDTFRGRALQVHWNESAQSAYITDLNGQEIVTTTAYWFAWFAFHPKTEVFKARNAADLAP